MFVYTCQMIHCDKSNSLSIVHRRRTSWPFPRHKIGLSRMERKRKFYLSNILSADTNFGGSKVVKNKLIEGSRVRHNHKPQPTLDTKRKRKRTKHTRAKQTNKCTRSTKTSSLFPKRGDQNPKKKKKKKKNGETRKKSTKRFKDQMTKF